MAASRTTSQSSEQQEEETTEHAKLVADPETPSKRLQLLTVVEKPDPIMAVQTWLDRSPPPYEELVGEERELEEEKDANSGEDKGGGYLTRVRVTGACLCKLSIVVYLLACVLVSALYVAIYGPNELYTTPEVAVPHPKPQNKPLVPPVQFYDRPYTEWIAERWTYSHNSYADWPRLLVNLTSLHQVSSGRVNGRPVVWFLSSDSLVCAEGFGSDQVTYRNISGSLNLTVEEGFIAPTVDDGVWLVTPINITLLDCSTTARDYCDVRLQWPPLPNNSSLLSATVSLSDHHLWLGTTTGLYTLNPSQRMKEEDGVDEVLTRKEQAEEKSEDDDDNEIDDVGVFHIPNIEGKVQAMAWRSSLQGTSGWGLNSMAFILTNDSSELSQNVSYSSSSGLYGSDGGEGFGLLVVTTSERVYFYDGNVWWFEWVSVWGKSLGGMVDSPPLSLTFVPTGELFIGTNVSLNILHINYTFTRIGPLQYLPYYPVRTLHYSPINVEYPVPTEKPPKADHTPDLSLGVVWVGTNKGYAVYDIGSSRFTSYHYGPRWHPGEEVRGAASVDGDITVLLTDMGVAVVRPESWTLAKKAKHYQNMLERHCRDPGLVASCSLTNHTPSSCSPSATDNDGLWTSLLVAAEAFRYKVTESVEAGVNAWELFQGMKFLTEVTGIKGVPARSVLLQNSSVSAPNWHNSTTKPDWKWRGDTSSEEVVGHMFAYPVVHDLLAISDEAKEEVSTTLDSIISDIYSNFLVDSTNQSTRWAVWSPEQLNLNRSLSDKRGLNSLQILSYLLSAFRITENTNYLDAWMSLVNGSNGLHYGLNMINQKVTFSRDINYSDDELAFLSYFTYFYTLKNLRQQQADQLTEAEMWQLPLLSLTRTWSVVKTERSALWGTIYGYCTGQVDPQLIDDIVWSLRKWPLELVQWPTYNSHRLDVQFNSEQDRYLQSHTQSLHVLPSNERGQLRWNSNPFELDSKGEDSEMDPGAWLLPYWMARWAKLL